VNLRPGQGLEIDDVGAPAERPAGPRKEVEQVPIRLRLAERLIGHNVRRHVERGLHRHLQGVLDEALLAHVVTQRVDACQTPEVRYGRHDGRQLLLDERPIGHDVAAARSRARLR
jgi:hypothetical protein